MSKIALQYVHMCLWFHEEAIIYKIAILFLYFNHLICIFNTRFYKINIGGPDSTYVDNLMFTNIWFSNCLIVPWGKV